MSNKLHKVFATLLPVADAQAKLLEDVNKTIDDMVWAELEKVGVKSEGKSVDEAFEYLLENKVTIMPNVMNNVNFMVMLHDRVPILQFSEPQLGFEEDGRGFMKFIFHSFL